MTLVLGIGLYLLGLGCGAFLTALWAERQLRDRNKKF